MKKRTKLEAVLLFEDGVSFKGHLYPPANAQKSEYFYWGEAAFTTGMTGYQETMTDPSYLGQHIIFSAAHIGNYPFDERAAQSDKIHASALIARNFSDNDFIWDSDRPLFTDCDTRSIIKYMTRSRGHLSCLTTHPEKVAPDQFSPKKLICNKLELVSQAQARVEIPGENPIAFINYGTKKAIVEDLKQIGRPLVSFPHHVSAKEVMSYNPQMVFLSNGPGDPRDYGLEIDVIKKLVESKVAIRSICLGHQLLCLALGAKVEKLPFGHRGINHPVLDHSNGKVSITSQNHGYAVSGDSMAGILERGHLGKKFFVSFSSLFDGSVEGISSIDHSIKTVQFHPEASPGPKDAQPFFAEIDEFLSGRERKPLNRELFRVKSLKELKAPKKCSYEKILIIGSGPIKIGQACEFDYSGTQACRALASIGVKVVLLNSNPATIMTDKGVADQTYIEPITADTVKKIIVKENVDAILSTMGGQTALNLSLELEACGFLKQHNVELLGAKAQTIAMTEDRALFSKELQKLGYSTGVRVEVSDYDMAKVAIEQKLGMPVIIRQDFALGGKGARFVHSIEEFDQLVADKSIKFPFTLEKSLLGHKEVELEVMVDGEQNGVIVCSIENIDACGVHTGDSITVAPALTISDRCYQQMRTMALNVAKHMGVVAGGANVQFAINPQDEDDITVIEMNPRVSRSSALASKATGYPIAKISAFLAVGFTLKDIINDITLASPVCFEPTQDYVAVKVPLFPFHKFPSCDQTLGPQMRSVGEVLGIGSSFNEAFHKALRGLEVGLEIPGLYSVKGTPFEITNEYIEKRLNTGMELSLVTVIQALRRGMSVESVSKLSKIDPWFVGQMQAFVELEKKIKSLGKELFTCTDVLKKAKQNGFSDKFIAKLSNTKESSILQFRRDTSILPSFKAVDTCSGEFEAITPYFYSTFDDENEVSAFGDKAIAIFGSGPNRIGQGVEFDYSCVKSCESLKTKQLKSIMINSNPETVSTDYDVSNRLYMAPLYEEDVFDILSMEKSQGAISSFAGQTGIVLREKLQVAWRSQIEKFNFLGPSADALVVTEDRKRFSELIKDIPLAQTRSKEVSGYQNLVDAIIEIGFPVIIRPSYVIGGESMFIFKGHDDIHQLPADIKRQLQTGQITFLVENYLEKAFEYDVDLIRDQQGHIVLTVCEHIEHAGVHSGDSGMITPPVHLTQKMYKNLKNVASMIADKLEIIGPINIQFAVVDEKIYCIEANPRGSRTLPFLSKAYDLSLPNLAVDAMCGETICDFDTETMKYFCVKQSTFPFDRFPEDNIILGPKMLSTGETMGVDEDKDQAILKSYLGNYPNLNSPGKLLFSLSDATKKEILPYLKQLQRSQYEFFATEGTAHFIRKQKIDCTVVAKIGEGSPTLIELIKEEKLRAIFNTPLNSGHSKSDGKKIRTTAISHQIPCFTRMENIKAVMEALIYSENVSLRPVALQEMRHEN